MATSVNSLYLVPFAAGDTTSSKLRVSAKSSSSQAIFSAVMAVQFITDLLPPITTTSNYMTIYHAGTDNTAGIGIFLKYQNSAYYVGVRYIINSGSTWNEVPGSFIRLADYTPDINKYPYVFMLSYNLTSTTSPTIVFSMAVLDDTLKTAAEFTLNYTFSSTNITTTSQWGFGSIHQNTTSEYGLIPGLNFNSYSSGGCYLSHLQGWTSYIPTTSGSAIYSLFNTSNQYSIYWYILYNAAIADSTPNLIFQIDIPNSNIALVGNSVTNPDTLVTLATGTGGFTYFPNFAINANLTGASPIVVAVDSIQCIYTGMKVLTMRGYVPVEELDMDTDKLITDKYKVVDIVHIYRYFVVPKEDTLPLIIEKGSCGAIEDTYLSQFHLYKVGDEFRLPIDMDLPKMTVKNAEPLCYYHIKIDNYLEDSIVVNGVVMEAHTNLNYMWLAKQNKSIEEDQYQDQDQYHEPEEVLESND